MPVLTAVSSAWCKSDSSSNNTEETDQNKYEITRNDDDAYSAGQLAINNYIALSRS